MQSNKDYYEILGVSRNATTEEIRQAYKNLVLKHHPDKGGTSTNIYDINEAFAVLSDPTSKAKYDMENEIPPMINILTVLFSRMSYFMKDYIQKKQTDQKNTHEQDKPKDIIVKMPIELEDLYSHKIKKLGIQVVRNGQIEKQIVYVSLANYEEEYVFKGLGDVEGDLKGDIVVKLDILPHKVFRVDTLIDKYDLWMECEIGLREFLYGKTIDVLLLDGNTLTVSIPYFDMNNMVHKVVGKGLPFFPDGNGDAELEHGNLYIFFRLHIERPSQKVLDNPEIKRMLEANFF
jgi:DnaJ-class molecular chaperone